MQAVVTGRWRAGGGGGQRPQRQRVGLAREGIRQAGIAPTGGEDQAARDAVVGRRRNTHGVGRRLGGGGGGGGEGGGERGGAGRAGAAGVGGGGG